MIPAIHLHPCYRCGSAMQPIRATTYYRWRAVVKCSNPQCRLMMSGDLYGDNGLIRSEDKSYEGEEHAFVCLAQRYNARCYNVANNDERRVRIS